MRYKLILYGAGQRCKRLCKIFVALDIEILAVIDRNPNIWGEKIEGYQIESPEKLWKLKDLNWCITVGDKKDREKIRKELQSIYNYKAENEVEYNELIFSAYKENPQIKKSILEKKIEVCSNDENVLFSCGSGLGLGGLQSWAISTCEMLINSGKNNIYIISNEGNFSIPSILENHIIYVNLDRKKRFLTERILNLVMVILEKLPCKIVTTHTDEIMLAAYLVKYYCPELIEIIATVHNGEEMVYESYMNFSEQPDIYIGVSQDIKEGFIQAGVDPSKIYTMSIPFVCDKILERTYTRDDFRPISIGYAGRMEYHQKRMDLLMKLMLILKEKKVNFKMELAGDGSARYEMESFVRQNNLGEKVKFVGKLERTEMSFFWKRQDICINLSDFEGRSISITEAMGNGAVPIVTATSGVREDITDTVNGYIILPGDFATMADRIEYLAGHREQLKNMGKLAHDAVYPKSLMEPYFELWREVLLKRSE